MKQVYIDGPDGKVKVNVGDLVCYKDDIETYGKVVRIEGSILTLKNRDGFTIVMRNAKECWDE